MRHVNLLLLFLSNQILAQTTVTVRLIKDPPAMVNEQPKLYFDAKPSAYKLSDKKWYNGESLREICFELETDNPMLPAEGIVVLVKDIVIKRVIIGRTDVPFTRIADSCHFRLVADTLVGGHIQTAWQNPQGGPFMWIYHNAPERVGGKYTSIAYPAKALAAALNFEVACQEMLRLMGDMSGLYQHFYGDLILLNCESSSPRGHLDFPPHWHLQHWEHGYNREYGINWRQRQYIIPHYYLDSAGNIMHNQQSLRQVGIIVKQPKKKFLPGDTCTWKDSKGNVIFRQIIEQGGLLLIRPGNIPWKMLPDSKGGDKGIWIYRKGKRVVFCRAEDDAVAGITTLYYDYYQNQKKKNTVTHSFRYDPYTGLLLDTYPPN